MSAFPWRGRPRLAWLVAVALLLALDQLSNAWFASTIALGTAVEVTTRFNLVHVLNTGAAFSPLAEAGGWQRVFFIAVGFVDLHWRGLRWPAFNLADVFIVLAAGAWILMSFRPPVATSERPS